MSNIVMTYGSYSFVPVPVLTRETIFNQTAAQVQIGTTYKLTLNGFITVGITGDNAGLLSLDAKQDSLITAMAITGQNFIVSCEGNQIYNVYPRIIKVDFAPSSNQWVYTSPYTIELEYNAETTGVGPYISEFTETWVTEFLDENSYYSQTLSIGPDARPYTVRLTHTIGAVGQTIYNTGVAQKLAWEQARDYIVPKLGFQSAYAYASGVFNMCSGGSDVLAPFNHVRTQTVDAAGGGFSVVESWILINPSGTGVAGKALEDFTIEVTKDTSVDIAKVTVNGTVQGLETRTYGNLPCSNGFTISESKYTSALAYWNAVKNKLYYRAVVAASGTNTRSLHTSTVNSSIGHNLTKGLINYTYQYDDRPTVCIAGALWESIVITDINPADVFAELPIIGRIAGPILQDINTVTSRKRSISIEALMPITAGCTVNLLMASSPSALTTTFINQIEADLINNFSQVFRSSDQESWDPKGGKYTRQVEFTYSNCA